MSKLLNELNRKERRSIQHAKSNPALKENKVLLLAEYSEEKEILEKLGLDHELQKAQVIQNKITKTRLAEEKFKRSAFSGEQLRNLCHKYHLRLLPTRKFKGTLPAELASVISDFCNEQDLLISPESFYILAPAEAFKENSFKMSCNPIIFYLEGSQKRSTSYYDGIELEDRLIPLHNWGKDFPLLRTYNWLWSNYTYKSGDISNIGRSVIFLTILIIAILMQMFIPTFFTMLALVPIVLMIVNLSFSYKYKVERLNNTWNKKYKY